MLTDSEEMKKLRAAGFDHDQAKAVLQARTMANDRARVDVILDMLCNSGFSPSQARVIARSACRHAQPSGNHADFIRETPWPSASKPHPRFHPFAVGAVICGLI